MNKEEFWKNFLHQKLVIYVPTKKAYRSLMLFFHLKGLHWINGDDTLDLKPMKKGIYIMATQEENDVNVLVYENEGDYLISDVMSSYYVLNILFRDEITEMEKKLIVSTEFLFHNILGHKIYEYDADIDTIRSSLAIDIQEKNDQYVIITDLNDYPLMNLSKTWFVNKSDLLGCYEQNIMVKQSIIIAEINRLEAAAEKFWPDVSEACLSLLSELKNFIIRQGNKKERLADV